MENKFGIKDAIIIVLLIVTIVFVVLSMFQFDRQHSNIRTIDSKLDENANAQNRIERTLGRLELLQKANEAAIKELKAKGVTVVAKNGSSETGEGETEAETSKQKDDKTYGDPFNRIKDAKKQEGYAYGDWYLRSFAGNVATVSPYISGDSYANTIQNLVLESLADRDIETLEWEPVLAKGWQISDDGLRITFQIRTDVNFSDGEPLTADDVVFTYNFIMNEEIKSVRAKSSFERILKVEKTGEYEVVFHYEKPFFRAFELAAGMFILPEHFYSQFDPEEYNSSTGFLMGSGPYRMETPTGWRRTDKLEVYRNERYWGPRAPFSRQTFEIINNAEARKSDFLSGDLHLLGATAQQYEAMKDDAEVKKVAQAFDYLSSGAGYLYIGWNQRVRNTKEKSVFADRRVRRAMTMMTPREDIISKVYLGYASITTGPFHPKSKQINPEVKPIPYDIDKAIALLKEAGFRYNERAKVMLTPEGKPFTFEFTYPSSNGTGPFDQIVAILKNSYAKAGVALVPAPLEWAVFSQKMDDRDYEVISLGWTGGPETDINQMFHSKMIDGTGDNFVQYSNPELDKYIELARAEINEEKRMAIWQKCHKILHEDQPYTFMFNRKSTLFISRQLHNVQKLESDLNSHLEWYVPSGLQINK